MSPKEWRAASTVGCRKESRAHSLVGTCSTPRSNSQFDRSPGGCFCDRARGRCAYVTAAQIRPARGVSPATGTDDGTRAGASMRSVLCLLTPQRAVECEAGSRVAKAKATACPVAVRRILAVVRWTGGRSPGPRRGRREMSDVPTPDDTQSPGLAAAGARSARHDRTIELLVTVLLAIATVATAWSSYQSARWSGVQTINFSRANAARVESTAQSTLAGQQTQLDVATFIAWTGAYAASDEDAQRLLLQAIPGRVQARRRRLGGHQAVEEPRRPAHSLRDASVPPCRSGQGPGAGADGGDGDGRGEGRQPTVGQLRPRRRPVRVRIVLRRYRAPSSTTSAPASRSSHWATRSSSGHWSGSRPSPCPVSV